MFNWYLKKHGDGTVVLYGDVCVVKMRHCEFVNVKMKYESWKSIKKKDRAYIQRNPTAHAREMVFIHKQVREVVGDRTLCCDNEAYNLINMDSHYEIGPVRKDNVMNILLQL